MCGFAGVVNAGSRHLLSRMLAVQQHRGPDDEGCDWIESRSGDVVGLGSRRLSILDLSAAGHMPMWNADRSIGLAYNGEVYNHQELRRELEQAGHTFRTRTDTEVVLALYEREGVAGFRRLRGMFACCLWDDRKNELVLARDPFGIKPLFLATTPVGTAFASEKKSLLSLAGELEIGLDLEPAALQHYLTLQYVPEPMSLHRMISRVESGTHVTVRPGEEPLHQRYFAPKFISLPSHAPASAEAEAIVHGEIADVLRDSVAKHMRADVTVGAFLSGGIDSTAIAALAKEHNPNLITFTTGFEREGYSEVDVAAESAAAIGVRHVVRTVKPDEMMEALPLIIWYLDDPVADPALVPLWFIAREARQHVKVVLSGEGADELFGGYSIYREPLSLSPFEKVPGTLKPLMRRASRKMPEGMRGKDLLRRGSLSMEQRYYGNARIFRDDQLHEVLRGYDPRVSHQDVTAPHYFASHDWDPVARMQHVDLFTWLRGDILVKADKMTMAHSLELRVPFLDPEVFDIASSLPQSQKITHGSNGTTKYALRRACEGIIPPHVLNRPKLGFPVPIRHWLRDEMYAWARDILQNSGAGHLIDLQAVHRMLDAHREGPVDHSRRIWAVLVFLLWHGIFVEKRIVPEVPTPTYPVKI